MPDVRFDEIVVINTYGQKELSVELDANYVHVCERDTIEPISYTTSEPCVCGLNVEGSELKVVFQDNVPNKIRVKLTGLRKHFSHKRFEKFTREEMIANNSFWMQWKNKDNE